jgi:hypothetical protein
LSKYLPVSVVEDERDQHVHLVLVDLALRDPHVLLLDRGARDVRPWLMASSKPIVNVPLIRETLATEVLRTPLVVVIDEA